MILKVLSIIMQIDELRGKVVIIKEKTLPNLAFDYCCTKSDMFNTMICFEQRSSIHTVDPSLTNKSAPMTVQNINYVG